ncbi:hypothetical protein MMC13_002246 [Lambiella insularis]|nr:hypothetical protein [Lambiella insularis]
MPSTTLPRASERSFGTEEKKVPLSRPNYNALHAQPLPLKIYPLPPLIPHNPLSILYYAFTFLYQTFFPPLSHPNPKWRAFFSFETRSAQVIDAHAIRALWENGFFGKGNLSRSEPSWLDREMRRRGIVVGETSEEITRRRREERREFKKKRARKEREAIEQALIDERRIDLNGHFESVTKTSTVNEEVNEEAREASHDVKGGSDSIIYSGLTVPAHENTEMIIHEQTSVLETMHHPQENHADTERAIEDQEHLQLTMEEAFFLAYGLGVLEISSPGSSMPIPIDTLFVLFRQNSYFPPVLLPDLRTDDPFLVSYVVYHHFRSLGWVVRSGVKFAVDYLLYNRGPVFSHAEFAVIILPSYRHSYWHETTERHREAMRRESKDWWWLHCVNRVQSQVRKSLVIAYVEIPPPQGHTSKSCEKGQQNVNVSKLLQRYTVREMIFRRWIPNRSRD